MAAREVHGGEPEKQDETPEDQPAKDTAPGPDTGAGDTTQSSTPRCSPGVCHGHQPGLGIRAGSWLQEQGNDKDNEYSHLKPEQRQALLRYYNEKQDKTLKDQLAKTMAPGSDPGARNNTQSSTPRPGHGHQPALGTRARSRHQKHGIAKDDEVSHLKPEQRQALQSYYNKK